MGSVAFLELLHKPETEAQLNARELSRTAQTPLV